MIKKKEQKEKIGELLLKKGLASQKMLTEALRLQKKQGGRIGDILIGMGAVSRFTLYQALAEHYKVDFVNLMATPVDKSLIEKKHRDIFLKHGFVPWKKDGSQIVIATTNLDEEVRAWAADHYKNYRFVITYPYDILWTVKACFESQDDEDARNLLWQHQPQFSAKKLFAVRRSKATLYAGIFAAVVALIFWQTTLTAFFITMNIFYVFALVFKAIFFFYGYQERMKEKEVAVDGMIDEELPMYTLLVPLFREREATIHNLITAVRRFDYPKSKLDVKLIVEMADEPTTQIIKNLACESYFEIIRVPYSYPQTKPKACNYALRFAKGEYVTIYDAEDIPEPQQLKKVIRTFEDSPKNVACVQARLNYYNRNENFLTRMFAIEYAAWFDCMLLGLEKLGIPIPLGGTSNHFRTDMLRRLYAWDPYNVTEDADLGVRLVQEGLRTRIVNAYTLEEAPVDLKNWLKQRSRWIKGYIQTYFVHMRQPLGFLRKTGVQGFFGFQFFVGAPSLVFITMPLIFMTSMALMADVVVVSSGVLSLALFNLIAGVLLHAVFAVASIRIKSWKTMEIYAFLFPIYWVLHMVASFRAVAQLIRRPHYWDKTDHGLTKMVPDSAPNSAIF